MKQELQQDLTTEAGFIEYLRRLTWADGHFEVVSERGWQRRRGDGASEGEERTGYLVHSLLGLGLRRLSCRRAGQCVSSCREPATCAYGRLFEAAPLLDVGPLSEVSRIPPPISLHARWSAWTPGEPLRFRVVLLGRAADLREEVTRALAWAAAGGVGRERAPMHLATCRWTDCSLELNDYATSRRESGSATSDVLLELRAPLRLMRQKKELRRFDLGELVRDLNFRVAAWGRYHQELPWAPAWRFLREEAASARREAESIRFVSFRRYSARQERSLPLRGLLGAVKLRAVTPAVRWMLHAGEAMGAGKGASVGLGSLRVIVR